MLRCSSKPITDTDEGKDLVSPSSRSRTPGQRGSSSQGDTKEYLEHIVKRDTLRQAILKAMADDRLDALAYPTIRRKANVAGQPQAGTNCHSSANSGLPAIVVPGGFTPRWPAGRRRAAGTRVERVAADQAGLGSAARRRNPATVIWSRRVVPARGRTSGGRRCRYTHAAARCRVRVNQTGWRVALPSPQADSLTRG